MSAAVDATLGYYKSKFEKGEQVRTWWTYSPKQRLKRKLCQFSGFTLPNNKQAMLVEVISDEFSLKRDLENSIGSNLSLLFKANGQLSSCNDYFKTCFHQGINSLSELLGSKREACEWIARAKSEGEFTAEIEPHIDNTLHCFRVFAKWFDDRQQLLMALTDISEQKQKLLKANFQATHDELTGLYNRRGMLEVINNSVEQSDPFHLVFIDVDRFKQVNDIYGHHIGDQLLRKTAERLQGILGKSCHIGRFGGDEFLALIPEQNTASIYLKLGQVLRKTQLPLSLETLGDICISVSAGCSIFPGNAEDADSLLKQAGLAMHQAKLNGRNRYHLFTPKLMEDQRRKVHIRHRLSRAVELNQFTLAYQPIYDVVEKRFRGAEALIRWHDEELGRVAPSEFVPVAEETGQIVNIGRWVLRKAIKQVAKWQKEMDHHFTLSINVSQIQLHPGFAEDLSALLQKYDVAAENIALELTESCSVLNCGELRGWLEDIAALGVKLYLDDFGTGYSSLSVLHNLPFNVVKLDKSFSLTESESNRTIIATTLALSKTLDMAVIAEGVETESQQEFLKQQGYRYLQGYYYSRPVSETQFSHILSEQSANH
ncbi:putative bifunctional diguanylate cyclase/phosphodiesterase [Veronia nyctiphanis]|nr:EAL domain-containing protein [Veronia nyctiphanis]